MKKFWTIALFAVIWLVVTAGLCWAQAPQPSLNIPNTEVYGGFLVTSPDYGSWDRFLLYGFEGAFSKGFTDRLWISATGSFVWGNPALPNAGPSQNPLLPPGALVPVHVKQFSGTVGPKFYIMTGKFRPYVTGQIGFAWQHSNGFYAADHHPPLTLGAKDNESGFTYRVGGGAEYQIKPKLYLRLVQWDLQPQPWGRHKPFYQNLGAGVGYRF
jgi:opacity protein-like surface antigen